MKHTLPWTLPAAAALVVSCFALYAPQASAGDDVLSMEGCVAEKSGNYTLVQMGDGSLAEVDMRGLNTRDKREQNTDPGQCFEWDLDPTGKPPVVFVGRATWAAEASDIGREREDQPRKETEREREAEEDDDDDDD